MTTALTRYDAIFQPCPIAGLVLLLLSSVAKPIGSISFIIRIRLAHTSLVLEVGCVGRYDPCIA